MPAEAQRRFRDLYLAYLRARDGLPDVPGRRFDLRERTFASLDAEPSAIVGAPPIDQAVFERNHGRRHPEPGLDAPTLWALATAKTNRSERYGVELSIEKVAAKVKDDDPHTYIQIEEFYHTRILRDALAALGLRMEMAPPPPTTRALIHGMVHLPAWLSDVAVLCGEIVGVSIFTLLLEKARTLFPDQPAALARIEALFGQILVDEVGHVHFLRSRVSARQMGWAKRLLPLVASSVVDDIPELGLLLGADTLLRHALAADVDAAAAPYADRLVVEG